MTNIKLDTTGQAAVNATVVWIPIAEVAPPTGVKLLLIDKSSGNAILGQYSPRFGHTHWQGLPKFAEGAK